MPAILRHFAINADNVQRAKAFYETVLGWTFNPWGPPGFYQVKNAGRVCWARFRSAGSYKRAGIQMPSSFSDETGMTIESWRQKARLVHSAAALAEGASVTNASLASGYDSPSAFSAAFRRQFGVTPKHFRHRSGAADETQ
jgi:hypothetical protein